MATAATLLKAYQDAIAAAKKRGVKDPQKDPTVAAARRAYQAAQKAATKKPTPAKDTVADRRSAFGWILRVMDTDAELKNLFSGAVQQGWTQERFQAAVRGTKWFQTHAEAWRNAETLRVTDPAEWTATLDRKAAEIRQAATGLGATLDDAKIRELAEAAVRTGWNESQLRQALGPLVTGRTGDAGNAADALRKVAMANGLRLSDDYFVNAARAVAAGTATVDTYEADIRQQAAGRYARWADQIKAGSNVNDLASAYLQAAQNELERADIDLFDPIVTKALTSMDDKGQPAVMPLWQFEQQLRADPRWQTTKSAQQKFASIGDDILKAWGLKK